MTIWSLLAKSIQRQIGRFMLFFLGVTIAVAGTLSPWMISQAMEIALGDSFDRVGANLLMLPPENKEDMPVEDVKKVFTIRNRENIAVAAPKVLGIMESERGPVTIMGVSFPEEFRLKRWWQVNGEAPKDKLGLVIGDRVAKETGWQIGQKVSIGDRSDMTVRGILTPMGTEEDGMVLLDVNTAAQLLGRPGRLTMIEMAALCATCPIEDIVAQLQDVFPGYRVQAVKEAAEMRKAVVERFTTFSLATGLVVSLAGLMLVGLTAAAQARERMWEIALLQALGYRRQMLTAILCLQVSLAGFAAGWLGYGTAMVLSKAIWPYLSAGAVTPVSFFSGIELGLTVGIATLAGTLAAYPVFAKATKKDPAMILGAGWGVA